MSVKLKLSLWFAVLLAVMIAAVLIFMVLIRYPAAHSDAREVLVDRVSETYAEIEYQNGLLELDEDVRFFNRGVYIEIYDADKKLLAGLSPAESFTTPEFISGSVQSVADGKENLIVYDMKKEFPGNESLWIRGITPENNSVGSINRLLIITLFLALLLICVGASVSFLIVRRAFRPIERIRRIAGGIQEGSDLTKRIGLTSGNDEVHRLAATFDSMLDRLELSFETEKQFTADASHELRTPVSVILAQCEYALTEGSDRDELLEAIEVVKRQAERMASLIGALLHISRMNRETGLSSGRINISEVARHVADETNLSKRAAIEFLESIEPALYVRGDAELLARLMLNLLDNAFRYTPDGGTVSFSLTSEDGCAVLMVRDTGTGIPAEHMRKIWNRFYRADTARTADSENHSGLGLAMVSEITALHGGRVSCTSAEGSGALFTFRIPLAEA